ncbi:MAG: class I tRNA ligase family protein, partial [Candidatus Pacearchaeota archaeon]
MFLKIYNTLSKKKEIFKPLKDKKVGIYTCGPTVYWYQHIGNLRSYIFPDILKKVLKVQGYKVKHVINVTDVGHLTSNADEGEDKIEKAAKKEGKNAKEISEFYFRIFREDLKKINVSEPDFWPKATQHI